MLDQDKGRALIWLQHLSQSVSRTAGLTSDLAHPAPQMATRTQSLNTLLQRATIDDHEEILKACNVSLKQSKTEPKILHTKAVALLKLDRYEDALRVLEEGGDGLKNGASLERSYALYKNGQLSEANDIANGIPDDRGARHVEAQAVCVHRAVWWQATVLIVNGSHIG